MINKKLFIKYMWYKGDYPAGENFTITTEKENSSNPRPASSPVLADTRISRLETLGAVNHVKLNIYGRPSSYVSKNHLYRGQLQMSSTAVFIAG